AGARPFVLLARAQGARISFRAPVKTAVTTPGRCGRLARNQAVKRAIVVEPGYKPRKAKPADRAGTIAASISAVRREDVNERRPSTDCLWPDFCTARRLARPRPGREHSRT